MSEQQIGAIGWLDLTCDNAEEVKDFYKQVVGWKSEPFDLGDYNDHTMLDESGEATAGVCHKRGVNADIPTTWLVYIIVADLKASMSRVTELGGKILVERINEHGDGFAVIEDPAGAICALYQAE